MAKKDDDILQEIRDRFKEAYDAVDESYREMIDDLEFVNNKDNCQWPQQIAAERAADGRPCIVINKLPSFVDQIEGDIKQNTPSIKVKPVDDKADPDTAEVLTGLIRNIENQSMADIAYDTAAGSSIRCGLGRFRIITEYADDDVFEQDIRIKRIKNPFTVFWDPSSEEWDKSDARYCFITVKISREEFKRLYPQAGIQEFPGGNDRNLLWADQKTIRIVEYWRKVPEKKTLYLMRNPVDGTTVVSDEKNDLMEVENTRVVDAHRIEWYKSTGAEIIEGPTAWIGRYIPIIDVPGKEMQIENRTVQWGVIRHSKDPQRLYNYSRSHNAEVTSLAPKSPYLVTAKMIANYEKFWNTAHKKNWPYLPYEPDPDAPGVIPQRQAPVSQNTGIITEIQIADQEIHDTTGLQLASMGKQSNEKSGTAIRERAREGDRGNFSYSDHIGKAIQHAGKILIDLIPKIYDSARVVRILGEDGSEDRVKVNQEFVDEKTGQQKIHDLTVGKYDVAVSVGPSYQTQREEAADGMIALFGSLPDQARMMIADLIVKNLDWPGSDEIVKRLKAILPPGLVDDGGPPPPPAPPDPLQQLTVEKLKAEVGDILLKHQKTQAEIDKLLIETRIQRDKAAEAELMPDDLPAKKMLAEIAKLLSEAKKNNEFSPSQMQPGTGTKQ